MVGMEPALPTEDKDSFDLLDNDYIDIIIFERVTQPEVLKKVGKPNYVRQSSDYEFERCSE